MFFIEVGTDRRAVRIAHHHGAPGGRALPQKSCGDDSYHSDIRGKPSVRMVCRPGGHSTRRGSVLARIAGVAISPGTPPSMTNRSGGTPSISMTSREFGA